MGTGYTDVSSSSSALMSALNSCKSSYTTAIPSGGVTGYTDVSSSPPSSVTAVEPSLPAVAPTSTMVCSLWVTTALQTTSSSRTAGAHPGETTATCKSAPAATSAASTASPATPRSAVPFRFECSLNDCNHAAWFAVLSPSFLNVASC